MYHKEFSPIAALTPYIRSYFYIRAKSRMFNFPADGCPGLINWISIIIDRFITKICVEFLCNKGMVRTSDLIQLVYKVHWR